MSPRSEPDENLFMTGLPQVPPELVAPPEPPAEPDPEPEPQQ